jgi:hypothetical protein
MDPNLNSSPFLKNATLGASPPIKLFSTSKIAQKAGMMDPNFNLAPFITHLELFQLVGSSLAQGE